MNTGVPWPADVKGAWHRVLVMQTKLHRWATANPGRRFDDLFNLVYDPAFLVSHGIVCAATGAGAPPESTGSSPATCRRCARSPSCPICAEG